MSSTSSYFCLWFNARLTAKGLTVKALANLTGVPVDTVRAWKDGRSVPRDHIRPRLYGPLGVTAADLAHAASGGDAAVPK